VTRRCGDVLMCWFPCVRVLWSKTCAYMHRHECAGTQPETHDVAKVRDIFCNCFSAGLNC
jgi:hypothetical protein